MHPAEEIRGVKSNKLSNKKIILGITGSIASVETVKLARELIRHGAEIIPVMTESATKIIHPDSLWFATGKKPITHLTGETEHVKYLGKTKKPADLLLISPCTANTISKIAHGIDDTTITTFATTALGSKTPIIIVPAMHISMYDHKIIQKNIKKLKQNNIKIIEPKITGNKAKIANTEEITANVIQILGKKDLTNKKILVIGGSSTEKIDDVRIITNISSGKTAKYYAKNIFYRNGEIELWYGQSKEKTPNYIKTKRFTTINSLKKLIKKTDLKQYDIIIICAALSDYIPEKHNGKISSEKNKIKIELKKSTKIIKEIRKQAPKAKIIGYKLEENKEKIKQKSIKLLKENKLNLVIANTKEALDKEENEIWIINKKEKIIHKKDNKEKLTNIILDNIIKQ